MRTTPRPRRLLAALLLATGLLAAACGDDGDTEANTSTETSAPHDGATADEIFDDESSDDAAGVMPVDFEWSEAETPAHHYPVIVQSCGEDVTFEDAPERAVVNDDNMIELMFALGLEDHMAAYAAAGPRLRLAVFEDEYDAVTDMGDSYFEMEPLLGQNPDFVFAGWNYGFSADDINPDSLGGLGIQSYVLNESCRRIDDTMEPASIEEWYDDTRNIAAIFGVPERAEILIDWWEERLARVDETLPAGYEPVPAFSYGFGDDAPGGGLGLTIVPELYRRAGAVNVFEDQLEMWGRVSWEAFVDSQPEIIVVTDYGNDEAGQTGEAKIDFLRSVEGVDQVPAIANDRFLILPQEAVNPGIRFIDGIEAMAAELYPDEFADLMGADGFGLSETYDAS